MKTETELVRSWGEPEPSTTASLVAARKAEGKSVLDLITCNPQEHGWLFPQDILERALADSLVNARFYNPDAMGQHSSRTAVARYHGRDASAEHIILTPGTSISYWYCFRLLAEPGDEILCPTPTYPLFDDLAELANVKVRRYHLHRDAGRWTIDPDELAFQVTPRTRAIVVVSPHNPTGAVANAVEMEAVARVARNHGLAVIFDEVFREFLHGPNGALPRVVRPSDVDAPLSLTLNGFSKMLSLPGIKAGWIVVEGDEPRRGRFLNAAEYLSDCFLPVSEYTQSGMPRLLQEGMPAVRAFADLYRARMAEMVAAWKSEGADVNAPQGGPYVIVPLSKAQSDEQVSEVLLREHGILMHPGSLYGLQDPSLVGTCIASPPWPLRQVASVIAER